MSTTVTTWKSRLLARRQIAKDVVEFRLQRPPGFAYQAGQFVQFRVPHKNGFALRSYSLASHPAQADLLFCVKLLPGGVFSTYAKSMLAGFELEWRGPQGRFVHAGSSEPLLFVATGAGLSPIYGLIHDQLISKRNSERIELLFGVRCEEDIFWMSELEGLRTRFNNFNYFICLSSPKASWPGKRGRVTAHLPECGPDVHAYICGSAEMVKDVRGVLIQGGLATEKLHFEIF